jgi:hypothetical protein
MAELDPLSPFARQEKVLDTFNQGTNQQLAIGREGLIKDVLARRAAQDALNLEGEKGKQTRANTALGMGIVGHTAAGEFTGGATPEATKRLSDMRDANTFDAYTRGLSQASEGGFTRKDNMTGPRDIGSAMIYDPLFALAKRSAGVPPVVGEKRTQTKTSNTTDKGSTQIEVDNKEITRGVDKHSDLLASMMAMRAAQGGVMPPGYEDVLRNIIPRGREAGSPKEEPPPPQQNRVPLTPETHNMRLQQLEQQLAVQSKPLPKDGAISIMPDGKIVHTDVNGRRMVIANDRNSAGLSDREVFIRQDSRVTTGGNSIIMP